MGRSMYDFGDRRHDLLDAGMYLLTCVHIQVVVIVVVVVCVWGNKVCGPVNSAPSAMHGFHPYMNYQYSQIGIKSHTAHWALGRLDLGLNKENTHVHIHTRWKDRWKWIKTTEPCKTRQMNNIDWRTSHPERKAQTNRRLPCAMCTGQTGNTSSYWTKDSSKYWEEETAMCVKGRAWQGKEERCH